MRPPLESGITWQDAAILLVICALCFALYPFFSWWTLQAPPWFMIYLLWALLLLLGFLLQRRFSDHDV